MIETTSELDAFFGYEDTDQGICVAISLATMLQCLCIARDLSIVPDLPEEWKSSAIPDDVEKAVRLSRAFERPAHVRIPG